MKSNASAIAAATLIASMLLAGCSRDDPTAMLTSAKGYLEKNDAKAAIIQIKNVLQANPDSPEGRYLLGAGSLAAGDPVSAEVELRKALKLGYDSELIYPRLAAAVLAQGEYKKVIDEFSGAPVKQRTSIADLQTTLSNAQSGSGNVDAAERALKSALNADSTFIPALIAQARLKAARNDVDGGLALLNDVLTRAPANAEALKLQGDILDFGRNDSAKALASYRKAIENKPDYLPAHYSILRMMLSTKDASGLKAELDSVKKIAANSYQVKYAEARYALINKDYKTASSLSQQLIRIAPDYPEALHLAGAVEIQTNAFAQAEAHLARAVQLAPKLDAPRQMLIRLYLRTGHPDKALTVFQPMLAKTELSAELYTLGGEVYLQNGEVKRAEEFYDKAAKLDPGNAGKRTTLAITRLVGGDTSAAFEELNSIAASDDGVSADIALVSAYLQRKEFKRALASIDGMEKKQPTLPLAPQLRARTQILLQDPAGARKSFERALELSPGYFPAVAGLASLDVADKKPDEAKKRFEAVIAKEPGNGRARFGLAQLAIVSEAPKEQVISLLEQAIQANPTDVPPRITLIDQYLRQRELKLATSAAQSAVAAVPDNADLIDALGRVQQASGEFNQAIGTYGKLAEVMPGSTQPLMRMADVHVAAKNPAAAEQALRKALDVKPDLLQAQLGLVMLNVGAGKYREAIAVAKTVQKQRPKDPVGYSMEGDVDLAQKNWDAAASAFQAGLAQVPDSAQLAMKLHSVLHASGKTADADHFSAMWIKAHPKDSEFLFYMGDVALRRADMATAEKNYAAVAQIQPTNAVAYNNLAWVANQQNKPSALQFARKANELAPNQPAYMDTMAMILAEAKEYPEAIDIQKRAVALQPDDGMLRLNLAKIYLKADSKKLAREELDKLSKLGTKFGGQAEVNTLLKTL